MQIRRLNESGVTEFVQFVEALPREPSRPLPTYLLTSPVHSETVANSGELRVFAHPSRRDLAQTIYLALPSERRLDCERDQGLWCWLTLSYFDNLCPKDANGFRAKIRESAAYIPDPQNFRRYYRHLLLGAFLIYRSYRLDPDKAMGFLCKPAHIIDDVVAQLAARQDRVGNRGLVEAVTWLYYDPVKKTLKKGAGGKGAASPRRLDDVLAQFARTFDLHGMSAADIANLLPPEFDRFRPDRTGASAAE